VHIPYLGIHRGEQRGSGRAHFPLPADVREIYPDPDDEGRTVVNATIYVERDSQKGIVIGKKGSRLRKVGQRARQGISRVLGTRVYLDLHVKVLKDWQTDPKQLGKLGF